jgi:NADPH:quinone reductase-like Zn-dependent oxidoreductase
MKAVLLKGHGGFEQLEYRDDVPVPLLRAGEVLIRVAAAGVNNTDINTRTAWYSRSVTEGTTAKAGSSGIAAARSEDAGWTGSAPAFPRIQGADACGHIVAVGDGVNSLRIGERVLVEPVFQIPTAAGQRQAIYFGSECDGAFAEFARVPSVHARAVNCPAVGCGAGLLSLRIFGCREHAHAPEPARGPDRARNGRVRRGRIGRRATGEAPGRHGTCRRRRIEGRKGPVPGRRTGDCIGRRSRESFGRESIDAIVDVVGGGQFSGLLEVLRRGGAYAVAGAIAGPIVDLDLRTLYLKDLRLLGCTVLEPEVFGHLLQYIERGEIRPLIAAVHPLAAIVQAQQEFLAKRTHGKNHSPAVRGARPETGPACVPSAAILFAVVIQASCCIVRIGQAAARGAAAAAETLKCGRKAQPFRAQPRRVQRLIAQRRPKQQLCFLHCVHRRCGHISPLRNNAERALHARLNGGLHAHQRAAPRRSIDGVFRYLSQEQLQQFVGRLR